MRFEAQRAGAEECELLMQAAASAPAEADGIIRKVCTSFREYTRRGGELLSAREELFSLLESGVSRHG